jgi:hypothetical protein
MMLKLDKFSGSRNVFLSYSKKKAIVSVTLAECVKELIKNKQPRIPGAVDIR